MAGGVIGVGLRELMLLPLSPDASAAGPFVLPAATMVVNVLGSFVLGVVVGGLGDRHPLTRAFVGTGVLGGFTTYSAFAVQTAVLLGSAPIAGVALAVMSVLLGLVAAAIGVRLTRGPGDAASGAAADTGVAG